MPCCSTYLYTSTENIWRWGVWAEEGNGREHLCPRRGLSEPFMCMLCPLLHMQMKLVPEHYPETCLSGRLLCHAEIRDILSWVQQFSHRSNQLCQPLWSPSVSTHSTWQYNHIGMSLLRQCRKKWEGHSKNLCMCKKCLLLEVLQLLLSLAARDSQVMLD